MVQYIEIHLEKAVYHQFIKFFSQNKIQNLWNVLYEMKIL